MRWKEVYFFVALAFVFVLLFAVLVYALTTVVYNDQVDFDSGQYNATNFTNGTLRPIDFSYTTGAVGTILEENQSSSGTIDMTNNYLLARFNETTANTLSGSEDFEDVSGNGYHGEDYGTVTYGAEGVFGNAVDLTSTGAIDFGDIEMSTWTELTVSAWINRTSAGTTDRIVSKDRKGVNGNWILFFSSNELRMQVLDGGTWRIASVTPGDGYIDGEWHHVVGTVDATDNEVTLWVDGVLQDTAVFNAATLSDGKNEEVVVGADSRVGTFSHYFTGYIDEVAIWDRELTSSEIQAIYNSASGVSPATEFLYESAVEDAGSSTDWQSLSWFQEYCYGCPLPDFSRNETSSWYNRTIDMDQTIFLYHFDESVMNSTADSQDFYDSSGNYFHANESGGVTLAPGEGVFGGAINFTGSEVISVGNINYSDIDALSMGAWFKTTVDSGSQRVISVDEEGVYGNFVFYAYGSVFRTIFRNTGGSWYVLDSITPTSDGEWHHAVAVADSVNNMAYLYIDGVLEDSMAYTHDPLYFPVTYETIIGADSDVGAYAQHFNGQLDEVFMVAQALSADEVESMYYRGTRNTNPLEFSVRSCNDSACSGENYTVFSGDSPLDISSLTDNQYVQLLANFSRFSSGGGYGPWLYNFTLTNQSLPSDANATDGQSWECQGCRAASEEPGAEVPSVILLDGPVNATSGTDRAFQFIWNNSATENVTYDLQVSTVYDFSSTVISETGLTETNASQTMYNITNDLDVDDIYYWRVRAVNGITPGDWSEIWEVEVLSYVALSLPTGSLNFSSMVPGEGKNTTDTAGLQPLLISNDGNIPVNITINATNFFVNSDGNYSFQIDANETNSYESAFDGSWYPLNSSAQQAITHLWYENATNTANRANLHLLLVVPLFEPPGDKSSVIEISTG